MSAALENITTRPDEEQARMIAFGHVAFGFVDLFGDRPGGLEPEERPPDVCDREQHGAG